MNQLLFENEGRTCKKIPITGEPLEEIRLKRNEIIDILSGIDDELAERIIENESLDNLDNELLIRAIRRATISGKVVPVLLGSAYKNTGVQPLIDAVIKYLPAPYERNQIYDCFGLECII